MVKERKVLRNGDIISFPMNPYMMGFGYVKFIDLRYQNPLGQYHNPYRWILYNYFTLEEEVHIDEIVKNDWLCNPLLMYWKKSIGGLKNWKILGSNSVAEFEYKEKYVRYIPHQFYSTDPKDYSTLDWICALDSNTDFNHGKWETFPYDHLRHLEGSGSVDVTSLPSRAYMEKCKREAKDIDISKISENDWYGTYMKCLDIPAYNLIPIEYRQKPIPLHLNFKWPKGSELYFNYYNKPINY